MRKLLFTLLLFASPAFAADKTIPDLAAATALDGTEPIETVQGGVSVKTTVDALLTRAPASAEANGTPIEITSGAGGATSGNGGLVNITAGNASTDGTGGSVIITGGSGETGAVNEDGSGGVVALAGGNGGGIYGNGGNVSIQSGNAAFIGEAAEAGQITISVGNSSPTGNGALISIASGHGGGTSGNGGALLMTAGNATGGDGNGGNITATLGTKTGSGTPGYLILVNIPTADPGVSGAVYKLCAATCALMISP